MLLNKTEQRRSKRIESCNIALQLTMDLSTTLMYMFASGALWQGLLLHCGLSKAAVGTLGAVSSVAQVLAMLLDLLLADRFKKPLLVMSITAVPCIFFYGAIAVMTFWGRSAFSFPVVLLSAAVFFAAYGFRSILVYKLPYLIIPLEKYGPMTAASGITANLLSAAAGVGITLLLEKGDYLNKMTIFYVICTVLASIVALSTLLMRPIYAPPPKPKAALEDVLADDSVRKLAFANFMRGISSGIIASITLIAAGVFEKDSAALSVMVTLTTVGAVLGNLLFSVTSRPTWLSRTCLIASVALTVIGPLSVTFNMWTLFLILFVALQIVFTVVNNTIPVMLAQSTPYHIIGGCTAVRMMETTLGTALSSWFTGWLLDIFDNKVIGILLMLVAGLTQVYCGVAYHRYQRSVKMQREESL